MKVMISLDRFGMTIAGLFHRQSCDLRVLTCAYSCCREDVWMHRECAVWSPNVYVDAKGDWRNVMEELWRSRPLNCAECRKGGASIGCFVESCNRSYHIRCAKQTH